MDIEGKIDITLENMQTIIVESCRVAEVAHDSEQILGDLEFEFERQTGLKGIDVAFLFFATALQCVRIFLINNLAKIEKAGLGNRNETILKNIQNKILKNFDNEMKEMPEKYYAPLTQIINGRGVPYDTTSFMDEKYKIFKGGNHRFATLGHDPVLGLIFGTVNILTNTITCVDAPMITTNHVVYDFQMKNPKISIPASTLLTIKKAGERINGDINSIVAAVIKQIIHIGSDMYTPCGIQLPAANLILSKGNAEKLTKYISTGDIIRTGAFAELSILINIIISTFHQLLFDENRYDSRDLYSVKTRKIIMYSNVIASSSNVIWVGANMAIGNKGLIKQLDIGGLRVTIHRLLTDEQFIRKIKEEFIFGCFNSKIQGENLNLKEVKF